MEKRGQFTLFLIIALIFLIGASLAMYFSQKSSTEPAESALQDIAIAIDPGVFKQSVENCIAEKALRYAELLAYRGGSFQEIAFDPKSPSVSTGITYYNTRYRYLCKNQDGHSCVNLLITRKDMQNELNTKIRDNVLKNCINFDNFLMFGYDVETGDLAINSEIGVDFINIKITYPTLIKKGTTSVSIPYYFATITFPLGRMYDLAVNIVNQEITLNTFDADKWMVEHGADLRIMKHKPYPDITYKLIKDLPEQQKSYEFNFALQGENTVSKLSNKVKPSLSKFCDMKDEKNCYANADEFVCLSKGGSSTNNPRYCDPSTTFRDAECEDGRCDDCPKYSKKHGDSWCVYDSYVGDGTDRVGTRHYKQSCIDGKIYMEECRDFREELCTMGPISSVNKAVCRPNRWEDCALQLNKNSCQDSSVLDCFWVTEGSPGWEWFTLQKGQGTSYVRRKQLKSFCYPQVPPGFRFWLPAEFSQINSVCQMANEITTFYQPVFKKIKDIRPPKSWVTSAAASCSYMGDCGNKRNILGYRIRGHYYNSDFLYPQYTEERTSIYGPEATPRIDAITLRNDVFNKIYNIVYNPFPTAQEAMRFVSDFHATASQWSLCKSKKWCRCKDRAFNCKRYYGCGPCLPETPLPENFRYYFSGSAICSRWFPEAATTIAQDYGIPEQCEFCNDDGNKPCSEYKCRSLGKNCRFFLNATTGVGYCKTFEQSIVSQGPLRAYFNKTTLPQGFSAVSSTFFNYNIYDLRPLIQPGRVFEFDISTNRDASCQASILPNQDFNSKFIGFGDLNLGSCGFSNECLEIIDKGTVHKVRFRLSSDEALRERLLSMLNYSTLLQASLPGTAELAFEGFSIPVDAFNNFISEAIGVSSDDAAAIINELLIAAEARRSILFFRCIDENGNIDYDNIGLGFTINITDFEEPVVDIQGLDILRAAEGSNMTIKYMATDNKERVNCVYNVKGGSTDEAFSSLVATGVVVEEEVYDLEPGDYSVEVTCSDSFNKGSDSAAVTI